MGGGVNKPQLALSKLVQYLKGGSSRILFEEFGYLKKQLWGRHLWTIGYMAISSGNITDELVQKYIEEQEGEAGRLCFCTPQKIEKLI